MKKITKILAAVTTALVLSFTGCVNSNADLDPLVDLSAFYLRGNMNNWCNDSLADGALTSNGDGTSSITYTAKAATDEFAIADKGWSVKYCAGTSVAVGSTSIELASAGDNAKVTGQIPGNSYKMTINPSGSSVFVTVVLAKSNSADFYLLDTTTGMNKFDYDGTSYTKTVTASGTTLSFSVWSENKYYKASTVTVGGTAQVMSSSDTLATIDVTVEDAKDYIVKVAKNADSTYSLSVIKMCPYFIVGATNYTTTNVFTRLSATDTADVYSYEFTYATSMSANWGSLSNGVAFKITDGNGSWTAVFMNKTLVLGADYVESATTDGNVSVSGLTAGTTYVLSLKVSGTTYSAKIAAK